MNAPCGRGAVLWATLDPVQGREQGGRRPFLVVASKAYLDVIETLVIGVPVTTRDRGWPHHVLLRGGAGLESPGWARTDQPRTIRRDRVRAVAGHVDLTVAEVETCLRDLQDLPRAARR